MSPNKKIKDILFFILSGALVVALPSRSAFADFSYDSERDVALRIEYRTAFSTVYYKDYKVVRSLAALLNKNPKTKLYIWGHTDSVGTHKTNQELSDARAENVKKLLIKFGVAEDRISTEGMSEDYPIASNTTKFGRARNRRSVARISGLEESQIKAFEESVKKSDFMALIDEKGNFANPNKSFDTFYKEQVVSENSKKTSSDVLEKTSPTKQSVALQPQESAEEEAKEREVPEPGSALVYEESLDTEVDESRQPASAEERTEINESYFENKQPDRRIKRHSVFAFFMPNWSSKYYGGDIGFEHGKLSPLGFGLAFKSLLSNKWYVKGHAYYLPTQVSEGSSGIDFISSSSFDYENNIYGFAGAYVLRSKEKSKLSLEASINSHILGGLERTSEFDYTFRKFNHMSLGLGLGYERAFLNSWKIHAGLHYLSPLSVRGIDSYNAKIWYRATLGMTRSLNKSFKVNFDYQAIYHESDFTFLSGRVATPEFFIQTILIGMAYNF